MHVKTTRDFYITISSHYPNFSDPCVTSVETDTKQNKTTVQREVYRIHKCHLLAYRLYRRRGVFHYRLHTEQTNDVRGKTRCCQPACTAQLGVIYYEIISEMLAAKIKTSTPNRQLRGGNVLRVGSPVPNARCSS